MNGVIFNIQRFCVNDGPGIRTTVFLKGCPLRCTWCHNPESQDRQAVISFTSDKCSLCGACMKGCTHHVHGIEKDMHTLNRRECLACGACADICPTQALELLGREIFVDEVMREVLKDRTFYQNSGGGITLSGGEPLMQFAFSYELLRLAKQNGLHTCMETCGFAKTTDILLAAEVTDLFLYDWKLNEDRLHMQYTGVSNQLILQNLRAIDEIGSQIILRCPIIPGVNDNDAHLFGIADIANTLKHLVAVEIEPYHSLGNAKYSKIGKADKLFSFEEPDDQQIAYWLEAIQRKTSATVRKA